MTIHSMTVTDTHDTTTKKGCRGPCKRKTKVVLTVLVVLILVAALGGYLIGKPDDDSWKRLEPLDPVDPLPPSPSWLHVFKRAAVCTDAPPCSQIGRHILSINGSAVDATIAAMFCNGLHNQQSMGLGGGFFMTVYIKAEEKAYTVIAREKAPAAAHQDMFSGSFDKASKGPLSVGVPGELRGMWAAHKRWGRLPWETLVKPTLNFCKYGFTMSKALYDGLVLAPYVANDPHLRKMYYDRLIGDFHWPGTLVEPSEALCNTLRIIAERGGDELYNGSLANDFLEDLNRVGSIITAEDLRDYQPKITEPIAVPLSSGDILYTPPPPSSGAILVNILNILSGYNFDAESINDTDSKTLTYHRTIEAFKYAYAARTKLGDRDFLDLDEFLQNITAPEYGAEIRLRINDSATSNDTRYYGATEYSAADAGTAHISVIADNGDAVSMTSSINFYFGAGFTTLNTGIVMNNVMDDFSSPGITNYFGIKPSPANFIAPGKRPLSSMSPSIIVDRHSNAKLVIGASGGTKIVTAIALDVVQGLRAKGHAMERYRGRGSIICALYRNKTAIYANADFRKGGDVAGMD